MLHRRLVVAQRLVRARDIQLGAFVGGAGRESILVVAKGLAEITRREALPAALRRSVLDALITSIRTGGYTRRVARGLVILERFDLLLHLLDLSLLLLNQLFVRFRLSIAASRQKT